MLEVSLQFDLGTGPTRHPQLPQVPIAAVICINPYGIVETLAPQASLLCRQLAQVPALSGKNFAVRVAGPHNEMIYQLREN